MEGTHETSNEPATAESGSPADFLLPLRRQAARLIEEGRIKEAGDLLGGIQRILLTREGPRRNLSRSRRSSWA